MDNYFLKNDINVFYVTASSFPQGITDAYNKLVSAVPNGGERMLVGFSCPNEEGNIIYHAAMVEEYSGEGMQYGFASFIIPKGKYVTETIENWKQKEAAIEHTFRKLVRQPTAVCPCVELYKGENMICLVKVGVLEN